MNKTKVEIGGDSLGFENCCFLCLQPVPLKIKSDGKINSANLFLKYLKLSYKAVVCENCEDNLAKYLKLSKTLEKVRIEMDYLLDTIQNAILRSDSKPVNSRLGSAREEILEKCLKKMETRQLQIILRKLYSAKVENERCPTPASDCFDDWNQLNSGNGFGMDSNSNSSKPDNRGDSSATPSTGLGTVKIKMEVNLEAAATSVNGEHKGSPSISNKVCTKCSKTFSKKEHLIRHMNTVHLLLKPYKCSTCLKEFSQGNHLRRHVSRVHKEGSVQSPGDKTTLRSDNKKLQIIPEKVDRIKPQSSTQLSDCSDDSLPNEDAASSSSYFGDDADESIPSTNLVNEEKTDLQSDKKLDNSPNISNAKSKTIATKKSIRSDNPAPLPVKKFKCSKCPKSFYRQEYLKIHNDIVHLRLYQFKCSTCLEEFGSGKDLRLHINAIHPRLMPHKCLECSKAFLSKEQLKNHNDTDHLDLKPFKCDQCVQEFSGSRNLREHIKGVHLRLKPHKCDRCDKSFRKPSELRCHKATGHKPKPQIPNTKAFLCETCEKTFANLQSLKAHNNNVHGRKVSCAICDKKFSKDSHLKRHVSSVHEKLRRCCQAPGCDKSYASSSRLTDHYRLSHPDFTVPVKSKSEKNDKLETQ